MYFIFVLLLKKKKYVENFVYFRHYTVISVFEGIQNQY